MAKRVESKKAPPTSFKFKARLWKYQGPVGWFFLTAPKTTSTRIRKLYGSNEEGWGRLKVSAKIAKSTWNTSVWFDTKSGSYLLPVRSEIRRKEELDIGKVVTCQLELKPNEFG